MGFRAGPPHPPYLTPAPPWPKRPPLEETWVEFIMRVYRDKRKPYDWQAEGDFR